LNVPAAVPHEGTPESEIVTPLRGTWPVFVTVILQNAVPPNPMVADDAHGPSPPDPHSVAELEVQICFTTDTSEIGVVVEQDVSVEPCGQVLPSEVDTTVLVSEWGPVSGLSTTTR